MKFEDFSPINSTEALVVCGESYNNLKELQIVKYRYNFGSAIKFEKIRTLENGTYLRLGNYYRGELYYSDNYDVFKDGVFQAEGIQPYMFDGGLLYQHHGVIFLNDEILIKPPTDKHLVVGRPTYYKGKVYYETRWDNYKTWEVWERNLQTNQDRFVINGANPFMYNDTLFFQEWKGINLFLVYKEMNK